VKRIVSLFGIVALIALASPRFAAAQRSGSLQATALVVDTREAFSDLASAQRLAASWEGGSEGSTVEGSLTKISITALRSEPAQEIESSVSPSYLQVTIQYLKN
jgi:hypothetical protein